MNPLILKLRCGSDLNANDEQKIEELCANTRWVEPHQDLISEGDRPEDVHLVLEGLLCRYKLLKSGRRQIMALLIPGDFCDLHIAILGAMDHGIAAMTRSRIVDIPPSAVEDIVDNYPRIMRGLWWATLVDEAVLREWLVSMGQRNSDQQMAHFFCEMFSRFSMVGQVQDNSFELPLTQEELGDTLGLSTVHVNRTLQDLRAKDLVRVKSRRVIVPNVERLFTFAGFNSNYLHLTKRKIPNPTKASAVHQLPL